MFGETIDLVESLQITVLGMAVVFIVLVLLMAIIKIMEKSIGKGRGGKPETAKAPVPEIPVQTEGPASGKKESCNRDLEIVAAIAAAAASCMGVAPSDLVIKNIVRMPEAAPIWGLSGRADLMASRKIQ